MSDPERGQEPEGQQSKKASVLVTHTEAFVSPFAKKSAQPAPEEGEKKPLEEEKNNQADHSAVVSKETDDITPLPRELAALLLAPKEDAPSSNAQEVERSTMMVADAESADFLRQLADAERAAAEAETLDGVDQGQELAEIAANWSGSETENESADTHAPVTMMQAPMMRSTGLTDKLGRAVEREDLAMATSQFSEGIPEWFMRENEEIEQHRRQLEVRDTLTEEGDVRAGLPTWLLGLFLLLAVSGMTYIFIL